MAISRSEFVAYKKIHDDLENKSRDIVSRLRDICIPKIRSGLKGWSYDGFVVEGSDIIINLHLWRAGEAEEDTLRFTIDNFLYLSVDALADGVRERINKEHETFLAESAERLKRQEQDKLHAERLEYERLKNKFEASNVNHP